MAKITNPIQYTSRTFTTTLNDINSDAELADKPSWWKRIWAGVLDVLSLTLNAVVNLLFLRTSYTRQAATDILALIDYDLTPQTTANGIVLFYLKETTVFPKTVALADIVGFTPGSLVVSSKRFESRVGLVVPATGEAILSTAANPATDELTVTLDYPTGTKVRLSGADLPVPLVAATDYYVIRVSAILIMLATTLTNAYAGTQIDITAQGTSNITIVQLSFSATLYQQETKDQQNIGTSDGVTEFQEFTLPDVDILRDTLQITINSESYARVNTFVESESADKVFKVIYNSDNTSKVQFPDGTFGLIPPAFDVLADYAVGGGDDSNVNSVDRINIYGGSDADVVGVSNPAVITGGADPQDIENGKILGPLLLKARNRFVTTEDGEALALAFGGFTQVTVLKNEFGVLSSKVIGIASGGGNPGTQLKADLQTHLIDRSILESIDVRVVDTTITTQNVTSAAKILPGFLFADVLPFFRLAWELFFSEAGKEIRDKFIADGVADATILINSIFSETFTSSDYDQISRLLENLDPRIIGESVQESSALGYVDSFVNGIDYLTASAPTFPVTLANDEITTIGALTLTEIP